MAVPKRRGQGDKKENGWLCITSCVFVVCFSEFLSHCMKEIKHILSLLVLQGSWPKIAQASFLCILDRSTDILYIHMHVCFHLTVPVTDWKRGHKSCRALESYFLLGFFSSFPCGSRWWYLNTDLLPLLSGFPVLWALCESIHCLSCVDLHGCLELL